MTRWPLRHLELSCEIQHTEQLPALLLPKLAPTLQSLSLDRGSLSTANLTECLQNFPRMTALTALRVRPHENSDELLAHFEVDASLVPSLQYLDGVTRVQPALASICQDLRHLRIHVNHALPSAMGLMSSLLRLELCANSHGLGYRWDHIPSWLCGGSCPNLQSLLLMDAMFIPCLPAYMATLTTLTELSLFRCECTNDNYSTGMVPDSSIFQMAYLHTINLVRCDFNELPAEMNLPSLHILRLSVCCNIIELPCLCARALPQLKELQLESMYMLDALPETLGELTTLQGLYMYNCPQVSIPMSLHALSSLRELVIMKEIPKRDRLRETFLSDVALCLPGLRGLRKLCLFQVTPDIEDTIAIGRALKAYPLPLLDLRDNKFPLLGLQDKESYLPMFALGEGAGMFNNGENSNQWHMETHDYIVTEAPFNFKLHCAALGLPPAAARWDDATVLLYWLEMQRKILSFVCVSHPRLGEASRFSALSGEGHALIADHITGVDTFRDADWRRQQAREIERPERADVVVQMLEDRLHEILLADHEDDRLRAHAQVCQWHEEWLRVRNQNRRAAVERLALLTRHSHGIV